MIEGLPLAPSPGETDQRPHKDPSRAGLISAASKPGRKRDTTKALQEAKRRIEVTE
ncbi:MAG: hypothetical protein ABJB61_07860 [bacterium]